MEHLYAVVLQWVQAYGLHGILVFMLAESAGLPLPTQFGFITAQGMLNAGSCSYWAAFAAISLGHLLGAGISYHVGRASDSALTRRLAHKPGVIDVHQKMRRWYIKYGPVTILFGRLMGHVRPWSSFVAGLSGVPVLPFWIWTFVGTLTFTAAAMWVTDVGYQYWQANRHLGAPIIIGMLIVFYGLPVYKGISHVVQRARSRRLAASDVDEKQAS